MLNEHATHLAQFAAPGTVVKVLPHLPADMLANNRDAAEREAVRSESGIDPQTRDPQS
jgi:hypothetical protein